MVVPSNHRITTQYNLNSILDWKYFGLLSIYFVTIGDDENERALFGPCMKINSSHRNCSQLCDFFEFRPRRCFVRLPLLHHGALPWWWGCRSQLGRWREPLGQQLLHCILGETMWQPWQPPIKHVRKRCIMISNMAILHELPESELEPRTNPQR